MENSAETIDILKMFIGEEPPIFYIEILLRTVIIYIYAFLAFRFIGQRAVGQISMIEIFLIVALGSAVGDPMFYPEVPLLHAILVISAVALISKLLAIAISKFHRLESILDGDPIEIIRDGVIDTKKNKMGENEVFSQLRKNGICNLSEVKVAYWEPSGEISFIKNDEKKLGLPIVPPPRKNFTEIYLPKDKAFKDMTYACTNCGILRNKFPDDILTNCDVCNDFEWTRACEGNNLIDCRSR